MNKSIGSMGKNIARSRNTIQEDFNRVTKCGQSDKNKEVRSII